jgi:hypothetical protein
MEETRKTAGQISTELLEKQPEHDNHAEIIKAQEGDYIRALNWCVDHARGVVPCAKECELVCEAYGKFKNEDFFVEVSSKQEKLMPNYIRNYFYARRSCPTPFYDQTVWKYDKDINGICYVWSVPDWESAMVYYKNAKIVDKEEYELLKFVIAFYDGSLYRLCRILNGEESATNDEIQKLYTPKIEIV